MGAILGDSLRTPTVICVPVPSFGPLLDMFFDAFEYKTFVILQFHEAVKCASTFNDFMAELRFLKVAESEADWIWILEDD